MTRKRIFFFLLTLLLTNCSQTNTLKKSRSKKTNLIEYADHFELFTDSSSTRLHILDPETGKPTFKAVLAKSKPITIPKDYHFIQVPVKRLGVLSATQIGMLTKLNAQTSISAVSNKNYIYDELLKNRINNQDCMELGNESTIPMERLINSNTQLLFYSDFGTSFPHHEQLKNLGVQCVPNPDWRETHPLGKAEWIKLFGFLTGKEKLAFEIFENTCNEYERLKLIAQKAKDKPSVLSGNILGDIWYAPAGESFNAILFEDAGCNYKYAKTKGTGSIQKSLEMILKENTTTKFWINPGFSSRKELLAQQSKLKYIYPLETGNTYCYSHNMNKFWELSASDPHAVLEDLIRIFHPELLPAGNLHFYAIVN